MHLSLVAGLLFGLSFCLMMILQLSGDDRFQAGLLLRPVVVMLGVHA